MDTPTRPTDPGSVAASLDSIEENYRDLEKRVRAIEDRFDTRSTPWWKRLVFRIDGWPSWVWLVDRPRWRPWRRWWTS